MNKLRLGAVVYAVVRSHTAHTQYSVLVVDVVVVEHGAVRAPRVDVDGGGVHARTHTKVDLDVQRSNVGERRRRIYGSHMRTRVSPE